MNIETDLVDCECGGLLATPKDESNSTRVAQMKMAKAAMKRYRSIKSPEKRSQGFVYFKLDTGLTSPNKDKVA